MLGAVSIDLTGCLLFIFLAEQAAFLRPFFILETVQAAKMLFEKGKNLPKFGDNTRRDQGGI